MYRFVRGMSRKNGRLCVAGCSPARRREELGRADRAFSALLAESSFPVQLLMRFRFGFQAIPCSAMLSVGIAAATIGAGPASMLAQRGGAAGPDTRPEVTFPVTIPPDDAKLQAMKKEAMRLIDSMSTFTQQMV